MKEGAVGRPEKGGDNIGRGGGDAERFLMGVEGGTRGEEAAVSCWKRWCLSDRGPIIA